MWKVKLKKNGPKTDMLYDGFDKERNFKVQVSA